ncbi:hypothetical protein A8990_104207 [Paenibacillus taihuensis]|uniref:Uncharacterized protein n=1 Tax=Paenibacillus taihuensis TaxID=1156355 RepID=A0A3D9SII1_9BACL|nr:hypothetical protein A8990_104207 [Paenibacillus taihuensis]
MVFLKEPHIFAALLYVNLLMVPWRRGGRSPQEFGRRTILRHFSTLGKEGRGAYEVEHALD